MFDILPDNSVKRATNRICGRLRPAPVRSGRSIPRLASRERVPHPGQAPARTMICTTSRSMTWKCFFH